VGDSEINAAAAGEHLVPNRCRNRVWVHCFEFNALLQAQRRLLLAKVWEKIAVSGESPGFAYRSVIVKDDVLADAAAAMDLGKVIRENRELRDIEFALARIRDGSYGILRLRLTPHWKRGRPPRHMPNCK
jgi:hypothetical protein